MERFPRKSTTFRDVFIALLALPLGGLLVWAGYGTSIDVIITVILVCMGLFGLMFMANRGTSSSEF